MKKILILIFGFIFCLLSGAKAHDFTLENFKKTVAFQEEMVSSIKDNWRMPENSNNLSTVIRVELTNKGTFKDIKVLKSSSNLEFDNSAKEAFLASIDKDDKMLRFYNEFTFKGNKTVTLTTHGETEAAWRNFSKDFKFVSLFMPEEASKIENNAFMVFKIDKEGNILDKYITSNTDEKTTKILTKGLSSISSFPKMKNLIGNYFYLIVHFSKYSSGNYLVTADKEKIEKIIEEESWKDDCYKTIEKMWQATSDSTYKATDANLIVSKDGYIQEFVFLGNGSNLTDFILKNVKLPKADTSFGYIENVEGIMFNNSSVTGKYVQATSSASAFANWGPYMRALEQSIKRNWIPPRESTSKRVIVQFTILRSGLISDVKVTRSSNNRLCDDAAMAAVSSASPFKPLPNEFKGEKVDIEFTFDYNVANGGSFSTRYGVERKNKDGHN